MPATTRDRTPGSKLDMITRAIMDRIAPPRGPKRAVRQDVAFRLAPGRGEAGHIKPEAFYPATPRGAPPGARFELSPSAPDPEKQKEFFFRAPKPECAV